MHPLGALLLMETIEEERRLLALRRRERRPTAPAPRSTQEPRDPWSAILAFRRFGLDAANG
jgi:hypothetical protein